MSIRGAAALLATGSSAANCCSHVAERCKRHDTGQTRFSATTANTALISIRRATTSTIVATSPRRRTSADQH